MSIKENNIDVSNNIVMKKISEIKPYVRNPRNNDKTVEKLCEVIPKIGFNVPLVIDENGVIVKGHARYAAAIKLGMDEVPCVVTHAGEDAVMMDRITDNRISEFSEWNNEELEEEINDIDFDLNFEDLGLFRHSIDDVPQREETTESLNSDVQTRDEKSEEEKEKLYRQFVESQKGNATNPFSPNVTVNVNTEVPKKKYYRCVCPDCGHLMFIPAEQLESMNNQPVSVGE